MTIAFRLWSWRMRTSNRIAAAVDNFHARRAYRAGWRVDADGWFYRRRRIDDRPPEDFYASGNAFTGSACDIAGPSSEVTRDDLFDPDGFLFCRNGQQALALDKGRMV